VAFLCDEALKKDTYLKSSKLDEIHANYEAFINFSNLKSNFILPLRITSNKILKVLEKLV